MLCSHCGKQTLEWVTASGLGDRLLVHGVRQNGVPPFNERVPFVVAVVDLDEDGARDDRGDAEARARRRADRHARPRQVAMYLAKQITQRSLPEIGRRFGNRDHTTVMHACSRVSELMGRDAALAEDVELLRRMLES